jgi:hypothetical protein
MKVKELIEKLKSCDPELMVVVNGYEGGVNEAENAAQVKIRSNVNTKWYYGAHEVTDGDEDPFDCEAFHIN